MSAVSELRQLRNVYARRRATARDKIKKYEAAYESLRAFSECVKRSHDDFEKINHDKEKFLSSLSDATENCNCAKRYQKGTQKTLSGVGMKVVSFAYGGLEVSVSGKLKTYLCLVDENARTEERMTDKIRQLDAKISALEAAACGC